MSSTRCANCGPIIRDSRGKLFEAKSSYKRIISLSPGTTELLFAVGAGDLMVGDTTYCDFPERAKSLPHVGDVTTSIEKVLALRPDLIVADAIANRRAVTDLERLGHPTFTLQSESIEQMLGNVITVGKLTRHEALATSVVNSFRKSISSAIPPNVARKPQTVWIVQFDPLTVVCSKNFMNDLMIYAGASNSAFSLGQGWRTVSPETFAVWQPDIILCGTSDVTRVKLRAGWGSIPAIKKNHVFSITKGQTSRPTPRMADSIAQLAALIRGAKIN